MDFPLDAANYISLLYGARSLKRLGSTAQPLKPYAKTLCL